MTKYVARLTASLLLMHWEKKWWKVKVKVYVQQLKENNLKSMFMTEKNHPLTKKGMGVEWDRSLIVVVTDWGGCLWFFSKW